jgi:aspartate/methionine/tyrosine aminotransferase
MTTITRSVVSCTFFGGATPPSRLGRELTLSSPPQYCRSAGQPDLVQALARHYSPRFGRALDPLKEITVSVGVSEVRR